MEIRSTDTIFGGRNWKVITNWSTFANQVCKSTIACSSLLKFIESSSMSHVTIVGNCDLNQKLSFIIIYRNGKRVSNVAMEKLTIFICSLLSFDNSFRFSHDNKRQSDMKLEIIFIFSFFFFHVIVKLNLCTPIIKQYTEWELSQCCGEILVLFLLVFFPTSNWFIVNDTIWDAVILYHFFLFFILSASMRKWSATKMSLVWKRKSWLRFGF